jgi:hypothetical protein
MDSPHDSLAPQQQSFVMHVVYVMNGYSIDIGLPMMMLIGDRV